MVPEETINANSIISFINELIEDPAIPKNVKIKLTNVITALQDKEETDNSIKADKAIHEIEEVSDDSNLQSDTRTQIWTIVSMLEKLR